ncbi:MAG TPA: aminodeoxychorismate synthase component I [Aliidongia sp.]|nr:aminodeoxychorismate synthase component I [Aliidongia sp.]
MIIEEIPYREPDAVFAYWAGDPYVAFLDSASEDDPRGRFSYLAIEPFRILSAVGGKSFVDGVETAEEPLALVERELAQRRRPSPAPLPFTGGAVGFLGYELGLALQGLRSRHGNPQAMPDMVMGLYDKLIGFDRQERRAWICAPEPGAIRRRLAEPPPAWPVPVARADWTADLTPAAYADAVARIVEHIRAGDLYQANFTARHRMRRPAGLHPAGLYGALRAIAKAPFSAYLACGPDLAIASASPERFLRLEPDGRIETRPIKGTRPRGRTPHEDRRLAEELAASVKDRAENLMIVDLLRNDLSRVAALGSVTVPSLCRLESFAHVHHLVSVVEARLRADAGPIDLLRATFPGGSITGAPKIRAMQLIDELEVARRGPYCGSILWLGFDGALDSSIAIRTLTITRDEIVAQAGGGIVADSDPMAEHEEMMVKIRPLLAALPREAP